MCRGYNQTTDSAQPDAEGRLWGYQNGANCVYIHPDGTPVKDVNELLPKGQETPAGTDKVGRHKEMQLHVGHAADQSQTAIVFKVERHVSGCCQCNSSLLAARPYAQMLQQWFGSASTQALLIMGPAG